MAKRRTSTALARVAPSSRPQVIQISTPRPVARRAPSRAAAPKRHRRRSSRGGKGGGRHGLMKTMGGVALASGLIGLAESAKVLDSLPVVPLIGKKGVVAVLAWAFATYGGGGEIARDVAVAATALATYQLGKEGRIDGDEG